MSDIDEKLKLSPYHKIFYNEWVLDHTSNKYNIVFDQTLSSSLNLAQAKKALHRFVSDHFVINSHVTHDYDEEPYWEKNCAIAELEYFDTPHNQELILDYVSAPFDIKTGPLYRFALFLESNGHYRFILVFHHLLIDGGSFDSLIHEISQYYNSSKYKTSYSLSEQEATLRNTAQLFEEAINQHTPIYQAFWDKKLEHLEPVDLRWAKSESDLNQIKGHSFFFEQEVVEKLSDVTKNSGISTYVYSQCVLAVLLHQYTDQEDITLAYPIGIKGGVPLISGAQVNTNITRYAFNADTTMLDLFKQNKQFIHELKTTFPHSGSHPGNYPISHILNNANTDLLDIMCAQTNLKNTAFSFDEVPLVKINAELNIDLPTKMILELEQSPEQLSFRIRYNVSKMNETILTNFTQQYQRLFLEILADLASGSSPQPIKNYSALSSTEYHQIIYQWNEVAKPCRFEKGIQQLFEEQVLKTPDHIALVYQNKRLTYTELNDQSNQLAHYLVTHFNMKRHDLVALYLDRSEYTIISILAVLKAGGAYVPIDTSCQENRIRYILSDTQAKILITDKHGTDYHANTVNINDQDLQTLLKKQPVTNLALHSNATDLVYIMYTSGTTGKPKGVMLEQTSVTARIIAMIEKTGINAHSKYLFKTNYVFDVSFSDIFMTLLSGASLYVTKSVFDVHEICHLIIENKIDISHFVPAQLDVIQHCTNAENNIFDQLKVINVSGEKFSKSLIRYNTHIKYVNYYGPTEAGEVSYDITDFEHHLFDHLKIDTIGYPLAQSKFYILNKEKKPVPLGAIGELYIGGSCLARGYLNQPALTAEKFIDNPFRTESVENENNRLYSTGDLVRQLPDRNMEFIGRSDNQIKIRGFRIELGEIEAILSSYPGIKQSTVQVQNHSTNTGERSESYLIAYYVSDTQFNDSLLSDYLAKELQEHMLPRLFVHMEKLPLTANGKINKQALPKVRIQVSANNYVAPKNELEQKICEIYADILQLDNHKVSANDNFFKLGGNSISAIRLAFKLQNYFGITVNDIFEYKTPAKLAQFRSMNNTGLVDRLEQIKLTYLKSTPGTGASGISIMHEHTKYLEHMTSFRFNNAIKNYSTVLLTGATGYLGCHLLYQLLSSTQYFIYLPIRGHSNEFIYTKLSEKFKYYFSENLSSYSHRINIFLSDLSQPNLDLEQQQYDALANQVDSIIHSAALVKHYGNSAEFHLENVQATIHLLELAKLTKNKDFHYISTIGVFTNNRLSEADYNIFTEDSIDVNHANLHNIYTKTKYQGEEATLEYRKKGVNTNIYRIGNLAINSTTQKSQKNIEDNAFFQRIKTLLKLGIISKEVANVEISPVDYTATAIILLFNQEKLQNQIYHVFNPKKCSLYKLLCEHEANCLKQVSLSFFIDTIKKELANSTNSANAHQVALFVLHQWGLHPNMSIDNLAEAIIFQDKTNYILNQLQFTWPDITGKMFLSIVERCCIEEERYV